MLTLLTALSLVGFTAATVSIQPDGDPPLEARMVFAGLTAIYVLFFNFSNDMNDPFDGVYQIKRSSAASYLLQIKWLVANQPWGRDIRFDTRAAFVPEFDGDVLEVAGEKSLGSTMKKMESVESAITSAALVSKAPGKVAAEETRGLSVDAKIIASSTPEQMGSVVEETANTEPSSKTNSKADSTNLPTAVDTAVPSAIIESKTSEEKNGAASKDTAVVAPTLEVTQLDSKVNGTANQEATRINSSKKLNQKEQDAKDFLPSYFRTLSGFNEDDNASDAPSVTVPNVKATQAMSSVNNGQTTASAYFRSVGGFMH